MHEIEKMKSIFTIIVNMYTSYAWDKINKNFNLV